ncbi:hypothetical protein CesoFtcFv8_023427 [Champsocephalus esox]|uniref:Uncharacterized protein n=1 Tax=Champsocephalus esox TaxID=159716 RepID=A0AAN8B9G7_9TELE|nr:hypothetical protein CesoFtcFv8_023427 [Champsocephalus esox]
MAVESAQEPRSAPLREAAEANSSCRAAKMHPHSTFPTTQTYVTLPVRATLGSCGTEAVACLRPAKNPQPTECKRPCFTVVLLQGFHSMQKEVHARGKVERVPSPERELAR